MSGASRTLWLAQYLVYLALSGKRDRLLAMYKYYVQGKSPAEIRDELGIGNVYIVYGIVNHVRARVRSHAIAARVTAALYPRLKDELPVVRLGALGYGWCDLCEDYIGAVDPARHLIQKHRQQIRELAEKLLREAGLLA